MPDRTRGRVEGYAIVSEEGMLATADRVFPESLIFEADQRFFEQGLDDVDVVVHGRHSKEHHARSASRRRLMLTTAIPALAPHPSNQKAWLWNPTGASYEEALAALGLDADASAGVIGGPLVFELFLDRYTVFFLSRAPSSRVPGGIPVFPDVPPRSPEEVLASHGLWADQPWALDEEAGLTMVPWRRKT